MFGTVQHPAPAFTAKSTRAARSPRQSCAGLANERLISGFDFSESGPLPEAQDPKRFLQFGIGHGRMTDIEFSSAPTGSSHAPHGSNSAGLSWRYFPKPCSCPAGCPLYPDSRKPPVLFEYAIIMLRPHLQMAFNHPRVRHRVSFSALAAAIQAPTMVKCPHHTKKRSAPFSCTKFLRRTDLRAGRSTSWSRRHQFPYAAPISRSATHE